MAEYIDKELLIGVLKNREECVDCTDTDCVDCMCDFIACIVPSDVAEVRHEHWQKTGNDPQAKCSNCGRSVVYQNINGVWEYENYCPHCGAVMGDGEE